MSLNALAPDQRAVVQLVLQQERTYDDLAELLGISQDAVRARAVAGLARLVPDSPLGDDERSRLTDYVLGQQGVSERERSRSLLSSDPEARSWARTVVDALSSVSGAALVEIPGADDDPVPARSDASPDDDDDDLPDFGVRRGLPPLEDDDDDDLPDFGARPGSAGAGSDAGEPTTESDTASAGLGTPVAGPRPRPRSRQDSPARTGPSATPADKASSSKLGGILLLAGVALVIAAVLLFLFKGGDDNDDPETAATPTATAQATPAPAFEVQLTKPRGAEGDAKGKLSFYVAESQGQAAVAFVIEATGVPESAKGETYGVWLIGNKRAPRRLGYTEPVTSNGELGASGPEEGQEARFVEDLSRYTTLVISRETSEDSKRPGPVVLRGALPRNN